MSLSESARDRLEDIRELEPTSNGELRDRWGMDSGKDVARYLREELGEYVYRDEQSRICVGEGSDSEATGSNNEGTDATDSSGERGEGTAPENRTTADGGTAVQHAGEASQSARDTVGMSPEELDEALEQARQDGYEAGRADAESGGVSEEEVQQIWNDAYEEGYQDGVDASERASTDGASGIDGGDDPGPCKDCGAELVDFVDLEAGRVHHVQGEPVPVAGDYLCSGCGEWWVDE